MRGRGSSGQPSTPKLFQWTSGFGAGRSSHGGRLWIHAGSVWGRFRDVKEIHFVRFYSYDGGEFGNYLLKKKKKLVISS
jgi:hypothetical protein